MGKTNQIMKNIIAEREEEEIMRKSARRRKWKEKSIEKKGNRAKLLKRIFVLNIGSLEMNLKGVPKYISATWLKKKKTYGHSLRLYRELNPIGGCVQEDIPMASMLDIAITGFIPFQT